ncbi:MAG: PA14 domain-containing protein [Caldilineales bacterium]|nr:PA14 domain-containing protein [Caldilineales bacterium]
MTTRLLTLAAVALALAGTWLLPDPARRLPAALVLAAGVVLAVAAFARVEREEAQASAAEAAGPTSRRLYLGLAVLVVGLALTGWALVALWRGPFAWGPTARWAGGVLLTLVGFFLVSRPATATVATTALTLPGLRPAAYKLQAIGMSEAEWEAAYRAELTRAVGPTAQTRPWPVWAEALGVLLILLTAAFFRLYRIETMPPGIFIDETNTALDALRILEGRPDSLFGTGWFETPNGFIYLQSVIFRLLGTTFAALKVQSVVPGLLTVLALWALARELFGPWPALLAGFVLAANRWHFHMSRWGWNEVYPPLFQVLAVLFIVRGARRRHWGDWALAGLWLGLGMYTYLAIRLAVLAVVAYLVYRLVVERGFGRRQWPGLAAFVVVYALVLAPLAFTYIKDPFTFLNRSRQVSIANDITAAGGSLQPLAESLERHLLMFHVAGDRNGRHNLPGAPMLDPITGAFFVLGAGWAVWRWRDHRRVLSLLWIGLTLLGGILSQLNEAPQAYRTLAVTPAIALLTADALALSLRGLFDHARDRFRPPWPAVGLAVVGLAALAWLNGEFYFRRQATDPAVYIAFSPLETAVAHEVLAARDANRLYLSPRLYYFAPLRFLAYEPPQPYGFRLGPWRYSPFRRLGGGLENPGYRLADPALDLPLPDLGGDGAVFLLDLHFEYVLDLFRYYYPAITAEVVNDRLGAPLYLRVRIPGPDITALQARNRADEAAAIRGVYLPASGEYSLSSPGRLLFDGRSLEPGPRFLGKGLHSLTITDLPADGPADAPVLFWEGPGGTGPVPDAALFRKGPSGQGLLGTYYVGSEWSGPVLMERVDPLILTSWPDPEPIFGPFSVTWTGELLAPTDGVYAFTLHADDGVRFWLDGRVLGESLNPDTVNSVQTALELAAGPHSVRIDYFQRGGGKALEFFWQPPGEPLQPVAPRFLRP